MRRDIVFVHIPKTAGTSLRSLLEEFSGDRTVLRDYADAPETTPALSKLVYTEKRIKDFRRTFDRQDGGILLSGHFPAQRYWPHFNAESFITFLRNPIDRVISEYLHSITLKGWTMGLEQFAGRPGQRYPFTHMLQNVNLDAFGFIGFMEDFDATLPALGEWLGFDLPPRRENIGDYAAGPDLRKDENARALIAGLAADDIALYERLRKQRGDDPRAKGAGPDVDGRYVGRVRLAGTMALGWLFNTAREFIAKIEISSGGETLAVGLADRYLEGTRSKGSRSFICGFRLDLAKIVPPGRTGGPVRLSFRAQGTDYELEGSPIAFTVPA